MAIRTIDFPDHTDPSFDPAQEFEAPNGITYRWNGYGWEVSCGFADPDCDLEIEWDIVTYVSGGNNSWAKDDQIGIDDDMFVFQGDQSAYISTGDTFTGVTDTGTTVEYTVQDVVVEDDGNYGTVTKVTCTPDPLDLVYAGANKITFSDLCEPVGKRYLLAHGDTVEDCDVPPVYDWDKPVTFQHGPDAFSKSSVIIDNQKIKVESDKDMDVFAPNGVMNIEMDTGVLGIGNVQEMIFDYDGPKLVGDIVAGTHEKHIVDKKYVDEKDAFLQGEIIELEQEIEGIALTSERGEWISATTVNPGEFRMVNVLGQNTQDYEDETINSILFNNNDAQNPSVEHGWADVEVGNILELLDKPDSDYAIYEITGINPGTGTMGFDVAFIKGVGEATLGDRTRIKIFAKPTGGDLEDYVRIDGDDMTGRLSMERTEEDVDISIPIAKTTAAIRFQNTKADGSKNAVTLYQPGPDNNLVCSHGFKALELYTGAYVYGRQVTTEADGSKTESIKNVSVGFQRITNDDGGQDYGQLRFETQNRLKWHAYGVEISRPVVSGVTAEGFTIKGDISTDGYTGIGTNLSTNQTLLNVKHNAYQSAAINYYGRITSDNNIATKKYVDDNAGGVDVRTDNPSNPDIGHLWYNTTTNQFLLRIS